MVNVILSTKYEDKVLRTEDEAKVVTAGEEVWMRLCRVAPLSISCGGRVPDLPWDVARWADTRYSVLGTCSGHFKGARTRPCSAVVFRTSP